MAKGFLWKSPICKICVLNRAVSGSAIFMSKACRQVCFTLRRIDNSKISMGRPAFVASLTAFSSGPKHGSKATVKALSMIRPFIWVPKSAVLVFLSTGSVNCVKAACRGFQGATQGLQ